MVIKVCQCFVKYIYIYISINLTISGNINPYMLFHFERMCSDAARLCFRGHELSAVTNIDCNESCIE